MNTRTLTAMAAMAALVGCSEIEQPEVVAEEPVAQVADEVPEPIAQATPERAENAITCNWPAQQGDTAEDLQALFGEDATVGMAAGGEGTQIPALILWPRDSERRIEVLFADDARTQITNVRIFDGSRWQIGGLSAGSTLAQANAANGRPFELFGFEWDYSGTVTDLKGGVLADIGGCRAIMSLGPKAETSLPDGVLGDVTLMSDDNRLPGDGIAIWELGLYFPEE